MFDSVFGRRLELARVTRSAILVWSAVALALAFVLLDLLDLAANSATLGSQVGVDYRLYIDTATRWLHGGPYFHSYQVAGPYEISAGDVLYPPVALLLFVPFTFLPAILWWLIPLGAVGWGLYRLRPTRIAWLWVVACATWPTTPLKVLTGNPVIWAVAAMSLGVVCGWPSVIVLIKPSLFPFALFRARSRKWWLCLGVFILLSVPFGALWLDWVHSVLNSEGGGVTYSALEIPMLAIPLVAWLGRTSGSDRGAVGIKLP